MSDMVPDWKAIAQLRLAKHFRSSLVVVGAGTASREVLDSGTVVQLIQVVPLRLTLEELALGRLWYPMVTQWLWLVVAVLLVAAKATIGEVYRGPGNSFADSEGTSFYWAPRGVSASWGSRTGSVTGGEPGTLILALGLVARQLSSMCRAMTSLFIR